MSYPVWHFRVDQAQGLTGFCDYLIARSAKIYYVEAPVVAVVEAKREDIVGGLGQCAAEMVAIQIFNERGGEAVAGRSRLRDQWQPLAISQVDWEISEH